MQAHPVYVEAFVSRMLAQHTPRCVCVCVGGGGTQQVCVEAQHLNPSSTVEVEQ
jgi:hypothetical protein